MRHDPLELTDRRSDIADRDPEPGWNLGLVVARGDEDRDFHLAVDLGLSLLEQGPVKRAKERVLVGPRHFHKVATPAGNRSVLRSPRRLRLR